MLQLDAIGRGEKERGRARETDPPRERERSKSICFCEQSPNHVARFPSPNGSVDYVHPSPLLPDARVIGSDSGGFKNSSTTRSFGFRNQVRLVEMHSDLNDMFITIDLQFANFESDPS